VPDTLKLTPGESLAIRESRPDLLELEGTWAPAGEPPPKHFHPSQDEHFEVVEGTLRARVDGIERELASGETLEVPRRAVHQMWNPGAEPARAIWQTHPGGRTEQWFRAIDRLHREGRVAGNGMPGPLAFAVLLTEYDDTIRLAVPAEPVVRAGLSALAVVGRARGYEPRAASD
jgi:mannose-6-phosphate isomerase-like protein (cupin superfamily)